MHNLIFIMLFREYLCLFEKREGGKVAHSPLQRRNKILSGFHMISKVHIPWSVLGGYSDKCYRIVAMYLHIPLHLEVKL